jgi:hypothetical protein
MKSIACIALALSLAGGSALAGQKLVLPDLVVEAPKPPASLQMDRPADRETGLTPPKSKWSADTDSKPTTAFDIPAGPCSGNCKLGVTVRQQTYDDRVRWGDRLPWGDTDTP